MLLVKICFTNIPPYQKHLDTPIIHSHTSQKFNVTNTNEILGDKYRHGWKRWIKRKGPKPGGNKNKTRLKVPEITVVMFVPKTPGGKLLNNLQLGEDNLGGPNW